MMLPLLLMGQAVLAAASDVASTGFATNKLRIVDDFLTDPAEIEAFLSVPIDFGADGYPAASPSTPTGCLQTDAEGNMVACPTSWMPRRNYGNGVTKVSSAFVQRVLLQRDAYFGETGDCMSSSMSSSLRDDEVVNEGPARYEDDTNHTPFSTTIFTRRILTGETPVHRDHLWDEDRTPVQADDPIGFVFLNDNPDAVFLYYDSTATSAAADADDDGHIDDPTARHAAHSVAQPQRIHPQRGRLVVFDGSVLHQTVVDRGFVHMAGPFRMTPSMDFVGTIDITNPSAVPSHVPSSKPSSKPSPVPSRLSAATSPTVAPSAEPTEEPSSTFNPSSSAVPTTLDSECEFDCQCPISQICECVDDGSDGNEAKGKKAKGPKGKDDKGEPKRRERRLDDVDQQTPHTMRLSWSNDYESDHDAEAAFEGYEEEDEEDANMGHVFFDGIWVGSGNDHGRYRGQKRATVDVVEANYLRGQVRGSRRQLKQNMDEKKGKMGNKVPVPGGSASTSAPSSSPSPTTTQLQKKKGKKENPKGKDKDKGKEKSIEPTFAPSSSSAPSSTPSPTQSKKGKKENAKAKGKEKSTSAPSSSLAPTFCGEQSSIKGGKDKGKTKKSNGGVMCGKMQVGQCRPNIFATTR